MDDKRTKILLLTALSFLVIAGITLYFTLARHSESGVLSVSFLDIGQGDAIYIEAPNGRQMIVDGGPGTAITGVLPRVMPVGDKSIDVILNTNPDVDHYSGFIPVLARYDVGTVIDPSTHNDTATHKVYEDAVAAEGVPHLFAKKGMKIMLDSKHTIYYEVLFPDRDVSNWSSNDGSIVGRLVYGQTSFMLMGDATVKTEGLVDVNNTPQMLHADILKLGHHGSHTSSSEKWIETVTPSYAIVSAGCNNKYGHPHPEVIARLDALKIPHPGTCEHGTITFTSDGKTVAEKFEK